MNLPLTVSHWPPMPVSFDFETTLGGCLREAAARWPDRLALVEGVDVHGARGLAAGARQWTFAELLAAAEAVGARLAARFDPGEHLALWATNRPEWTLVQFGAALAGLTVVTVNPAYGQSEVEFVLGQSRSSGAVVESVARGRDLSGMARGLVDVLPGLREVITLDDLSGGVAMPPGDATLAFPRVAPSDAAQIQYTSGTTGFPKGALLAHRGLALNGRLFAEAIGAGPADVWVNPMPLFHTAGCGLVTMGALQTGGTHVLPAGFDPDVVLDLVERHRGTVALAVPTMLVRLLDAQLARPRDLSSWRLVALGGAPVPPELVRRAERELGVDVAIGFGQTESSPYLTHTRPRDPDPDWRQTVGKPLPLIEIKIADPISGEPSPLERTGEICTRSPCVMLGYFDNPEATAAAIDADGWLHTGDLGSMDSQGNLQIRGRLKDMIIRGGENIYPREIEDVLYGHDAVANASVVGVPDEEWGEVVVAFVQIRPNAEITAEELEVYCRGTLASFKVPRQWVFVSEFPQTSSGKVQKFALREQYLQSRFAER